MKIWIELSALIFAGACCGFGCSSDGDGSGVDPAIIAESAGDGGAAGADFVGRGGDSSAGDAAGGSSAGTISDGASGASNCESDVVPSRATLSADLPIPFADAGDATFTACRNSDCYSGKGDFHYFESWWVLSKDGQLYLSFDDATVVPSVTLEWTLYQPEVHPSRDHFRLTVQRAAEPELVIFDTYADYDFVFADSVDPDYCSKIYVATVDLRTKR